MRTGKNMTANADKVWKLVRQEAEDAAKSEPVMADALRDLILGHTSMGSAFARVLGLRMGRSEAETKAITSLCAEAFASDGAICEALARDMQSSHDLDPACHTWLQPFMHFKGVSALAAYRAAAWLWRQGRQAAAYHLQGMCSQAFQVDIHPAAVLGSGIFVDHATGIVIGETSVVGDDVTIMQSVTLGGNGKERGDRHPKICKGALIGAGAKVLGNIRVGEHARVAACSVVLKDVPPHTTVAGIPARPVRTPTPENPAQDLEQGF